MLIFGLAVSISAAKIPSDLARTPEDLLVVPAKIRAMQGNLALSESIAPGVKEIAISANKVIK